MYQQNENHHLEIDHVGRAYILETVRWTKFLAILGFIVMGLVFISGLLLAVVMPSVSIIPGTAGSTAVNSIGLLFLVGVYFYPIYALSKFSSNMKAAMATSSQTHLNEGLRYQRSMYKYIGILTIIMLIFYLLMFLFVGFMIGGFAANSHYN
ncbi:MAG: hypothetical protein JSS96_04955 [Bacteroidetes bacterium]|nr:hypothetical protein [Bacteroidota bacterium]